MAQLDPAGRLSWTGTSHAVRCRWTRTKPWSSWVHHFLVALASSIVLKGNDAVSNGGDGFQIFDSTRTQVIANDARGNAADGFFVIASGDNSDNGNLLQRNSAVGNRMNGIAIDVTSIRNRVVGNTVTGHIAPFFDRLDMNPNCRRPA
jgi:parallel beta-helix repeat protein